MHSNVIFDEKSNGGQENAAARTVPEIQAKGTKLNFFTINLRFLRKNEETRCIQCSGNHGKSSMENQENLGN